MSDLKTFCDVTSNRIAMGLAQELDVYPGRHYRGEGYSASRVLSLRLVGINPAYLPKVKKLQGQLSYWAGLSDEYRVRIGHDAHAVIIEVPKPKTFWKQVTIEQLEAGHLIRRGAIATLGLGLQDEPKRVNFTQAAMAHLFITGATRSGKTNTEKLIGWNLARNTSPADAQFLIFDVAKKGYKWSDFDNLAHLAHPVIKDITEADRVLSWLTLEIDRRATQRRITPRLFVFIDELKALNDDSQVASDYLSRVASVGGEFGLHLILSTQYPQIKMLGSAELKRNVTTRLCGKVDDATAAANALGIPDSGAETLGGYGDFLLKDFDGLSRLTVAHIQAKHIDQLERAEIMPLDLPDSDTANSGPKPSRQPDELEPEHVALALFEPMGINKLAGRLSIGSTKARRVKEFADAIRQWAFDNGHNCLEP
jgi:DNA segregation ATPase FtsK/SpoIIIE-like protein